MKKITPCLCLFIFLLIFFVSGKIYSQSVNINYILEELENITYVKVLTPLGNQPNSKKFTVTEHKWNAADLEKSKQYHIYNGGLFKQVINNGVKYLEKNNFLEKTKSNCVAFLGNGLIYLGTDNGIAVSTNDGESWIEDTEDAIDNLSNRKINFLKVISNVLYAGTDDGIFTSTDNGVTWDEALENKNVSCIEISPTGVIFVGTSTGSSMGVYKYDNGSWVFTSPYMETNCLLFDGPTLYAGTSGGLRRTTDNGSTWSNQLFNHYDDVTCIFIEGLNIFIGTSEKGCRLSVNSADFTAKNTGLPKINSSVYYKINALIMFNNKLYAGTDNRLFLTDVQNLNTISWLVQYVKDKDFPDYGIDEKIIRYLYVVDNSLWVVCFGDKIWSSAQILDKEPELFNYENFPNYQCHAYAWHMYEGGNAIFALSSPNEVRYVPPTDATDLEKDNWDYIEVTEINEILDMKWQKVTYDWGHSAVLSENNPQSVSNMEDIIVISKWSVPGPLVEHKLKEHPWQNPNTLIRFWTNKKETRKNAYNEIEDSQCIGRELYSTATTVVPTGKDITLYVAPVRNHKIHLRTGFHAKSGCRFHAYVKDYYFDDENNNERKPCKIPWEEEIETKINSFIVNDVMTNNSDEKLEFSLNYSDISPIILDSVPCKREDLLFEYSGKGSGTAEDPYQITNVHQMQEVILDIHGDRYWVLMNDIDASETRYWNPYYNPAKKDTFYNGFNRLVGSHFRSLDGRGFKVKNLFMSYMNATLFSGMNCLTLRRIGFENLTVVSYDDYSIGRRSLKDRDILIEECFFDVNLTSKDSTYDYGHFNWVTGFIGQTEVKNSYIQWNVNIASGDTMLPFIWSSAESNVENCYVTGTINGINIASPFGYEGEIKSCFWDADRIKVDDKRIGKGLGLSTEDMKKRYTYESAGWDFENVWYIDEGMDYPKLRAFKRDTTSVEDLSASDIVLSPNPATDYVEVAIPPLERGLGGVVPDVRVFNLLGVCVITSPPAPLHSGEGSKVRLDVSHLPPGVYFVQSGSRVQRFVKM